MPEDDRMAHYLGREYMFAGQWENCIATPEGHLALKSATWREERCASTGWIAVSYHQLGDDGQAYCWYYRALAPDNQRLKDNLSFYAAALTKE